MRLAFAPFSVDRVPRLAQKLISSFDNAVGVTMLHNSCLDLAYMW